MVAAIALFIVLDVLGLCVLRAALHASRGGAWSLLRDDVPALVRVYNAGAHDGWIVGEARRGEDTGRGERGQGQRAAAAVTQYCQDAGGEGGVVAAAR